MHNILHFPPSQADVIINSTSNGLDLQNGAVSSSILREAGAGLQDECRAKYPKGIQTGEIACTSGYGLGCREVYHLVLCNWSNPNAQQVCVERKLQILVNVLGGGHIFWSILHFMKTWQFLTCMEK